MSLQKRLKKIGAILVAALPLLTQGCIETYESKLEKKLQEKGYTREQAEVGVIMGQRMLFMAETKKLKAEDGTATYEYVFNHSGVTINDMREKVDEVVSDLEEILSHKNDLKYEKFLDSFKLRGSCEKQLKVFKYLQETIGLNQLHNKFNDFMGTRPQAHNQDPHAVRQDEAYSLSSLLPRTQKDDFIFDAKYVQDARAAGKLSNSACIVETVERKMNFQEKINNPDYPLKDKNKQFIFKERSQSVRAISYCLDDNEEKLPTYVEVYRINETGVQESKPAIKIFRPINKPTLQVIVVDKDRETDKKGHGKPDYVLWLNDITRGSDILKHQELLGMIFQVDDKPPVPKITASEKELQIVETGKHYYSQFELTKDGWERFLPDYKNAQRSVTIHIKYKPFSIDELAKIQQSPESASAKAREIEWIAKEYSGWERIVEFYRPADSIKNRKIVRANIINNKEIEVFEKGAPAQKYTLDDALEQRPYRIDFDVSEKRWSIIDRDNNGNHYEAKQEISKPDNLNLPK